MGKDITQIEVFLSKIPKVQRGSVTKFATYFISGKFQTQFVANLGGSGKCTYLSFQQREKRKCLSPFLQLFPQSQTFKIICPGIQLWLDNMEMLQV